MPQTVGMLKIKRQTRIALNRPTERLGNFVGQEVHVNGLGQANASTHFQNARGRIRGGVGGDGDHAGVLEERVGLQAATDLETIDSRHAEVEDNDLQPGKTDDFACRTAVECHGNVAIGETLLDLFLEPYRKLLIVVYDENPGPNRLKRGRDPQLLLLQELDQILSLDPPDRYSRSRCSSLSAAAPKSSDSMRSA